MVPEINYQRVFRLSGVFQYVKQISDERIESAEAVVVVGCQLAQVRSIDPEVRQRLDVVATKRLLGQTVDLPKPRTVGIGIIDTSETIIRTLGPAAVAACEPTATQLRETVSSAKSTPCGASLSGGNSNRRAGRSRKTSIALSRFLTFCPRHGRPAAVTAGVSVCRNECASAEYRRCRCPKPPGTHPEISRREWDRNSLS